MFLSQYHATRRRSSNREDSAITSRIPPRKLARRGRQNRTFALILSECTRSARIPPPHETPASNTGVSRTYRVIIALATPIVFRWGRLTVMGLEHVPAVGALILAGNHDSHWDPIVVGVAARSRRQICALA